MSKNIEMQELTSNRYELLYPKTSTAQINGIENYDWQIGDIRSTARTDLGDKWLLCNGSVIDTSNEYSDVGDLLGKSAGSWVLENTVTTNNFFISSVSSIWAGYVNGKYVAMGIDFSNSNNVTAKISYSDSLEGNWTQITLKNPTSINSEYMYNAGITFLNRTYYAGAVITVGMMTHLCVIWASTDLNNWSLVYNSGNKNWGISQVGTIKACSNKIAMPVFCSVEENSITYHQLQVVQMSTTNSTWNITQLYSLDSSYWDAGNLFVSVANDVLFITCWVNEAINSGMKPYSKYQLIFNSTSAQGWSRSTFLGPDSSGMNRGVSQTNVSNVIYINGTYYIVGTHIFSGYDYNAIGYGDLYSSTSATSGTMTWNLSSTQGRNIATPCYLLQEGKFYVFYTNGKYSQMNSLDSNLPDAITITNVSALGEISLLSTSRLVSNNSNSVLVLNLMEWTSILPNITVDKGYAYIKVKN